MRYLTHLGAHYGTNPYHNRLHGSDVVLGIHRFFAHCCDEMPADVAVGEKADGNAYYSAPLHPAQAKAAREREVGVTAWDHERRQSLTAQQTFGSLLAAALHDFSHPGTTNAHEVKVNSALAQRYREDGPSLLECHHLVRALRALSEPCHDFTAGWPNAARQELRELITHLVLMTDPGRHQAFVEALNAAPAACLLPNAAPDATLLLTVAIKAADLGHALKPWALHLQWSRRVTAEFHDLGDRERAAGVEVSALCDRHNDCDLARSQISFLQHSCLPIYTAVATALPNTLCTEALSQLKANIDRWGEWDEAQDLGLG